LLISAANGVLDNDFGPSGETLTANILTYVDEGVLSFMANGGFSYDPPTGWTGTTSFTYEACGDDPDYCSLPATVTISVTEEEPKEEPTAVDDVYTTGFNEELIVKAPGVLENDTAPEGEKIVAQLETDVPLGEGILRLDDDGGFSYTPPNEWSGTTSFTYQACLQNDLAVCSDPVTVTIEVGPKFMFFFYLPLITE
jgi:hypothetical protein